MAANWWYNLVARKLNLDHVRLVCVNQNQKLTIDDLTSSILRLEARLRDAKTENDKLAGDVKRLEQPTHIGSWIGSNIHALKRRNEELERDIAKVGLLRDALRNEKAYAFFLEDCLECKNPGDVFNALPLEKRKEYFDRVK
jgi:predicted RNase H-like nuclease (RuvC/YqgF family)